MGVGINQKWSNCRTNDRLSYCTIQDIETTDYYGLKSHNMMQEDIISRMSNSMRLFDFTLRDNL